MHHDFTRPVIHRDVKCSNILLDCEFRAKIADFGLARILAKSGESEAASAVCGTFGYIAPEYVNRVKVSDKVDVYSFGVVLLELATGRGAQDGGAESGSCLSKWAATRALTWSTARSWTRPTWTTWWPCSSSGWSAPGRIRRPGVDERGPPPAAPV